MTWPKMPIPILDSSKLPFKRLRNQSLETLYDSLRTSFNFEDYSMLTPLL